MNLNMRKMEGVHGYKTSVHMEKDNKKMPSYIYDWIGKEDRNDTGSLI